MYAKPMKPTISVIAINTGDTILIGGELAIVITTRWSTAYNCWAIAYQRGINTPTHIAFAKHGERFEYVG